MSETGPSADIGCGGRSSAQADAQSHDARPLPWLLRQKVSVPERAADYLDRAELATRTMPTHRRLTVLHAPGGFGKTTLLAECCRRLREDGIPTAWVSVDEQDEPAVLDAYIGYACRNAAAGDSPRSEEVAVSGLDRLGGGSGSRVGPVMHEIAEFDGPFVLVLDELERLRDPGAGELLEFLLRSGPPNLHLAFACRELPSGLNIAGAVLEGRALIVSAEELRFSSSEVAEFFDGKLSSPQLAGLMTDSAGWPFALRVARNEMGRGRRLDALASQEFVENWVESRLFAGLGREDREFLFDIGLFDWMDAALLDEVLDRHDSVRRIETIPVLVGLLEPVHDGVTDMWRLHPLIREHCARRRLRETPERFRRIHRRIAEALMRRDQTVSAMRHAVEAGEPALAGDILERAGGGRLILRDGTAQFLAADRWLSEAVIAERPRLALARCLALIHLGRMEEARKRYRSIAAPAGNVEDEAGDVEFELAVDHCMVRGTMLLFGGERFGSALFQTHLAEIARLALSPRVDVAVRGMMEYGLCVSNNMTAAFEVALDHAARARRYFDRNRYMTMYLDIQLGQIAMAQGRATDAAAHYRTGLRVAKKNFVLDPIATVLCRVHLQELALECSRVAPDAEMTRVPGALVTGATPLQAYAAASGAVVDLSLRDEGVEGALAVADEMLTYVRKAGLTALVRYVSALRVSLLALAGRIGDGERAWAADNLPEASADCLDLAGQTWREMEAISCARLRLEIGCERFDAGRALAADLCAVAAAQGLQRTLMRGLALSVVLERRAGEAKAAAGHMETYLRAYGDAPYAGPLLRERADCAPVLTELLDSAPHWADDETARSLLAAMEQEDTSRQLVLSAREREVLQRLGAQRDKQIAAELGLSTYGVRHHLRKLFAKLGVRKRAEAVRRAREMGLVSDDY